MHGAASSIGCFCCCPIKISRARHHHANVTLACSRQPAQLLSLLLENVTLACSRQPAQLLSLLLEMRREGVITSIVVLINALCDKQLTTVTSRPDRSRLLVLVFLAPFSHLQASGRES
jgi:hypothetical protein